MLQKRKGYLQELPEHVRKLHSEYKEVASGTCTIYSGQRGNYYMGLNMGTRREYI